MINEHRKHNRVPVRIPVGIYRKSKPQDAIDAEILDISEGGAFVHCSYPIKIGEEIAIEIRFAETTVLEGKVVEHDEAMATLLPEASREGSIVKWTRSSSVPGFGLQFETLRPDKVKFLRKLVQYFEKLHKAGVSFQIPEE